MRIINLALAALAVLMAVGCTPSGEPGSSDTTSAPTPTLPGAAASMPPQALKLRGTPLPTPAQLSILVASNPPVEIDADTGATIAVTGLAPGNDRIVSVMAADKGALVASDCPTCGTNADVYFLSPGTTDARHIGKASAEVAAHDGRAIWLKSTRDATHCSLAKVTSAGRVIQAGRPFDCDYDLRTDTSLGLLVSTRSSASGGRQNDAVLSPDTLRPIVTAERIYAVANNRVVSSSDGGQAFTILDPSGKHQTRFPGPPAVGEPADTALLSLDGRYLAFLFGNPACPGPRQCLDVWLLDLRGNRWLHPPSMPTAAALKVTDIAWAADGRLVIVGDFDGVGSRLAAWRPNQQKLQLRSISLPAGRSPAFVVWM